MQTQVEPEQALAAWRAALGDASVDNRPETLDRYARSTQPEGTRPSCILYPKTREEVRDAVLAAAAAGMVLYPISRGENWGYGDACAPTQGAAILDLSRMNRILEINSELGYAIIEPGVTQQELYEAVRLQAPGFWLDCTGAGRDASVVGNVLERGFGHTPYGDHMRTVCGLEVVLADGRILNTGLTHYPNARAARAYPYGVGPALDGLFTQSNFGVVTKIGLWLYPAPEGFRFFYIGVDRDEALEELVDALRPLRMRGILNSAVHIANDLRIISSHQRYPWDKTDGAVPLPKTVRNELRRETGVRAWNVSGSLAGPRAQVRAAAREISRAMRGIGRVTFVDDRRLALGKKVVGALARFGFAQVMARQLALLEPNYGLLKGIPTDNPIGGVHWRLRSDPGDAFDPRDTGAGLIWLSPVLPVIGQDARAVMDILAAPFAQYGFDPLATFTLLNERAMVGILNVAFDKAVPGEAEAAAACYAETMQALKNAGYPPYRTSPMGMPALNSQDDVFWAVAQDLKRALDPNDIIARGRYIPPLH